MTKQKSTTIHDIADALGINSSTVSRALNDHPKVSEKTKKKVREMATQLNYRPNVLASNLRTSRSGTIGVIVPFISRYFFSTVIAGIEEEAHKAGYNVLISQSKDRLELEKKNIKTMMDSRVEGILISPALEGTDGQHIQEALDHGVPVFFFDRYHEGIETTKVLMNDRSTAKALGQHLLQEGGTHFLLLTGQMDSSIYRDRAAGIKDALESTGRDWATQVTSQKIPLTVEGGIEAVENSLKKGEVFDVVYAMNDLAAIGAVQALLKAGKKIPEDYMVVGFSNEPTSELIHPSITTVNQSAWTMGKTVTRKLVEQLKDKELSVASETTILKSELVIRTSSSKRNLER
ncbi:LacI family DNA-binding transcriptional regulator [Algivirga pacifica]|uniref:LacI family DNA-binding transcriptional regulator n=1 Tax=Algivirga pacifica TaxID=1162670 RepID=A0ABP9D286_9BACT